MDQHWTREHFDKNLDCQYCGQIFTTTHARRKHEFRHEYPFECHKPCCYQRFKTLSEALTHSAGDDGHDFAENPVFICPLQNCRAAVIERPMPEGKLRQHWERHVSNGHIVPGTELTLIPATIPPLHLFPLFERIAKYEANRISDPAGEETDPAEEQSTSASYDMDDAEQDYNEEFEEMDPAEEYSFSESDDMDDAEQDNEEFEEDLGQIQGTEEELERLQEEFYAELVIDDPKDFFFREKPLGVRDWIFEPCRWQSRIDLDTAYIKRTPICQGKKLPNTLSNVCAGCEPVKKGRLVVAKWSGFAKMADFHFRTLEKHFLESAKRTWKASQAYDEVRRRMTEIEQGSRRGTDLIVLDTEFTMVTAQVMEVAAVERLSGKTVINTLLKHSKGISHVSSTRKTSRFETIRSQIHAAGVYAASRTIDRMNVREFAASIVESGITPDTMILVWHWYDRDLELIRRYLASAKQGYEDLLPPKENCIPLIKFFNATLGHIRIQVDGKKRRYPLKLEILFQVMFPRSALVGRNHQALVDSEQTRLVMTAFDWLCEPVEHRGSEWKPDQFEKPIYPSIVDFYGPKSSAEADPSKAQIDSPNAGGEPSTASSVTVNKKRSPQTMDEYPSEPIGKRVRFSHES
ncbi:unnamed protein product [Fusarium equiseti]|uniref:C2H2-type domain-containing protein n=1 Tax=Fusarium equiseti TaxID=61235 RepID=A0A8J2NCC2_FUSEQ|nr:unnamed protein product [Fusarium equiseti]